MKRDEKKSVTVEKEQLRQKMLKMRACMSLAKQKIYSAKICAELYTIIKSADHQVIHCYIPMRNEVNTMPLLEVLLREGKTVICPKTLTRRQMVHLRLQSTLQLESGLYGTKHPKEGIQYDGTYDLIIVPGLAFDEYGYRLGYGGGYYDSFLDTHGDAVTVGVCYPDQCTESVPREAHDARLDQIICGLDK